jgi:predicted NUDIX family phosphoesterase
MKYLTEITQLYRQNSHTPTVNRIHPIMNNNLILCLDRKQIPPEFLLQSGYVAIKDCKPLFGLQALWKERDSIEKDPNFKQLIPYALVISPEGEIAVYPRKGSEERLHQFWSVGVGGHVDKITDHSDNILDCLHNGLIRELNEEFRDFANIEADIDLLGIINEEETAVGSVHLGIVFLIRCKDGVPLPGEELMGLEWHGIESVRKKPLELWSDLTLELFLEKL